MEGERRKRKLENEIEEESEEQKMEKFFALIKSTKDARDRLSNNKENNKKEEGKSSNGAVWNPTFQVEDFIDDKDQLATIRMIHHKEVAEKELLLPQEEATVVVPVVIAPGIPSNQNIIGNKKKFASDDGADDLDLTLSL